MSPTTDTHFGLNQQASTSPSAMSLGSSLQSDTRPVPDQHNVNPQASASPVATFPGSSLQSDTRPVPDQHDVDPWASAPPAATFSGPSLNLTPDLFLMTPKLLPLQQQRSQVLSSSLAPTLFPVSTMLTLKPPPIPPYSLQQWPPRVRLWTLYSIIVINHLCYIWLLVSNNWSGLLPVVFLMMKVPVHLQMKVSSHTIVYLLSLVWHHTVFLQISFLHWGRLRSTSNSVKKQMSTTGWMQNERERGTTTSQSTNSKLET